MIRLAHLLNHESDLIGTDEKGYKRTRVSVHVSKSVELILFGRTYAGPGYDMLCFTLIDFAVISLLNDDVTVQSLFSGFGSRPAVKD